VSNERPNGQGYPDGTPESHTGDGIEPLGAYREGQAVEVASLGATGSFEPARTKQPFDLVVFDKNHPRAT
jgi:hypothetical protein